MKFNHCERPDSAAVVRAVSAATAKESIGIWPKLLGL